MILAAKTLSGNLLENSKRIYLDNVEMHCVCPNCKENVIHRNTIPILVNNWNGNWYCHVLYCDHCNYESKENLYLVNAINNDSIDLNLNTSVFDISVYQLKMVKTKIEN